MSRLPILLVVLSLGACAVNLGGPKAIDMPTVALRAEADAAPASVAGALDEAGARVAFIAAARDDSWFDSVAARAELELSGPADMGDLALAFLGPEPLGDTTLTLPYDGGELTIHDALYEIEEDRLLDLLAFRIEGAGEVRSAVASLLEYVATDVNNSAAVVLAALVPTAAAGDSVARMLSPAYFDAVRCEPGTAPAPLREGIRLFYGPEARMYCAGASAEESAVGAWIRAELIMGRR